MNLCREEHTLSPIKCSPSVRAKPMVIISHVRSRSLSCAPECRQHNHNPSGKRIACSFLSQNPLPPSSSGWAKKARFTKSQPSPIHMCVCVCFCARKKHTAKTEKPHTQHRAKKKGCQPPSIKSTPRFFPTQVGTRTG